jgi:hypothetical protein
LILKSCVCIDPLPPGKNPFAVNKYYITSPNSNEEIFLDLLDEAVNIVLKRGRFLVICGDWNINLLYDLSTISVMTIILSFSDTASLSSVYAVVTWQWLFMSQCITYSLSSSIIVIEPIT